VGFNIGRNSHEPPFETAVGSLPPFQTFQLAVGLQQWRQAGWQLSPVETAVSLSLPPIQSAVGFVFDFFLFVFFVFVFLNTINAN
jgi:hypothetical protein